MLVATSFTPGAKSYCVEIGNDSNPVLRPAHTGKDGEPKYCKLEICPRCKCPDTNMSFVGSYRISNDPGSIINVWDYKLRNLMVEPELPEGSFGINPECKGCFKNAIENLRQHHLPTLKCFLYAEGEDDEWKGRPAWATMLRIYAYYAWVENQRGPPMQILTATGVGELYHKFLHAHQDFLPDTLRNRL